MLQQRSLAQIMEMDPHDPNVIRDAFQETSERSELLLSLIPDHLLQKQILCYLSPPLWDFNHMANVEEQWLANKIGGMQPIDERNHDTYNMMLHPRTERGKLEIPRRDGTLSYRHAVRENTLRTLEKHHDFTVDHWLQGDAKIWWNIITHEHQHQETVLQSIDRYSLEDFGAPHARPQPTPDPAATPRFVEIDAGAFEMGLNLGSGLFGANYDCEAPKHQAHTEAYEIGKYPVTNGEFIAFLQAGGYDDPQLWSEEGQKWLQEEPHHAPLDWYEQDGVWMRRNRHGIERVQDVAKEILTHVTFHEANAYATWVDARLPNEREWEKAARHDPETGRSLRNPFGDRFAAPQTDANCDVFGWAPSTIGSYDHAASPLGVAHLCGDVWEWSHDQFHGYPGFEWWPYKDYSLTWYNVGQYSLRGGSWASRSSCATATFRNWDLPHRRQIHVGFRLARDL